MSFKFRVVTFPLSALWQEPLAYARYRVSAAKAYGNHAWVANSEHYSSWHAKHGNKTYETVRWGLTLGCAASFALYAVNEESKNCRSSPADAVVFSTLAALLGAIVGRYAHVTLPLMIGYKGFALAFNGLKKYHKRK
jgi:hypothetical protein